MLLEGLAKARTLLEGFGLGIDALAGAAVILGPAIDQAPARPLDLAAIEFGSDDEVLVGRGNIEPRPITHRHSGVIVDAEFVDYMTPFVPGQGKPLAHLIGLQVTFSEALARDFSSSSRLDFDCLMSTNPQNLPPEPYVDFGLQNLDRDDSSTMADLADPVGGAKHL
jgi:hypothetical protein